MAPRAEGLRVVAPKRSVPLGRLGERREGTRRGSRTSSTTSRRPGGGCEAKESKSRRIYASRARRKFFGYNVLIMGVSPYPAAESRKSCALGVCSRERRQPIRRKELCSLGFVGVRPLSWLLEGAR